MDARVSAAIERGEKRSPDTGATMSSCGWVEVGGPAIVAEPAGVDGT